MNIHDQDIYFKAKNEGIKQGEYQAKVETAKSMLLENLPLDLIHKITGLSKEIIEKLQKEKN